MHDDDEFLRSIPPFLRRTQQPPPRKLPIRPRDLPAATATPAPAAPKVVEVAQPSAAEAPAAQRAHIALAFDNQDMAETRDMTEGSDIDRRDHGAKRQA